MCFDNDADQLAVLRNQNHPITVWKRGTVNSRTGFLETSFGTRKIEWRQGATVKPHQIRKPLKHMQHASAGLYFYTTKEPAADVHDSWRNFRHIGKTSVSIIILAEVDPKDVIAANYNGMTICCTKAKVIKALNPDDSRIPRLTCLVKQADQTIKGKDRSVIKMQKEITQWKKEREEYVECLEQMTKQLAQA